MGRKKKFIDKKNATKFYLGHRSQKDPLAADPDAPQRVLIPIDEPQPGPSGTAKNANKEDIIKKREEQAKWGIYFDDDYDYLKHLKDSKEVSNIEWDICERIAAPTLPPPKPETSKEFQLKLPSSVFESEYVEEIGLLNKAAPSFGPRPDLDPDIIAALDDDFDYEDENNELEDNFMELANASGQEEDGSEDSDEYEDMSDEDELGSLGGGRFSDDEDEKQTRFTNYSMSSSVVKRNDQLTLIDDRFEKMFEGYEDTEIGALDCDEIEGDLDPSSQLLRKLADEFQEEKNKGLSLPEKISKLAIQNMEEESSDSQHSSEESEEETQKKFNCETILSTIKPSIYKPKLIADPPKNKIRIKGKFGMPEGVFGKGLTAANLKELDRAEGTRSVGIKGKSIVSTFSFRSKTETPAERMERKRIVREYRKERREEKKANAMAFRDEKKRQEKVRLNNRANLQGLTS